MSHPEFMKGLNSITDVWQALADNAYENSLEALQTALYGRISAEHEEDQEPFQFKAEANEGVDQGLDELLDWIVNQPALQEEAAPEEPMKSDYERASLRAKEVDRPTDWVLIEAAQEWTPEEEPLVNDEERASIAEKKEDFDETTDGFIRAFEAPAEVLVWNPGPYANGWGRWARP